MGRRESDAATKRKMSADEIVELNDEDEEAIRAKLRESGWKKDKKKEHMTDTKETNDKESKSNGSSSRRGRGDDHGDDDRSRRSSRRSRSSRRRESGRSSRRRRSQSVSKSRSRSVSSSRRGSSRRSTKEHRSTRDKRRSRSVSSRSRSHSRSNRKRSRRSRSTDRKESSKRRSSSADKEKKANKDDNDENGNKVDNAKKENGDKPVAEDSKKMTKERDDRDSDRKSSRKSSRRSRSAASRSRSRSRRRRRSRSTSRSRRHRRSSRSRSRSGSRSRRRRDRDRDRRRRSRSRSRSRSRRRSRSKDTKRRDANSSPLPHEHPPGTTDVGAAAALNPSIAQLMQQYPTMSLQDIIAKMQSTNVAMAAAVSMKPARELYVGNLPPNITGPQLQEFLGTIIQQVGLSVQPGNPIISTWISTDGHFAFCEMRSIEECNLALLLNQLPLLGQPLKFGRPKSFLGPPQPMPVVSARTQTALANLGCTPNPQWFASPSLDVNSMLGASAASAMMGTPALVGLPPPIVLPTQTATTSSNALMMSNIPVVLTEDQVKELVQPFGDLKSFTFIKDPATGEPTGSAVFEYENGDVTEEARKGLDGLDLGGAPLVVARAPVGAVSSASVDESSPVVKMANMVSVDELNDDEEFADLKEDVEEECKRFGTVIAMTIPRPKDGPEVKGVGNIYVRFETTQQAQAALKALSGRKFGPNIVKVTFFPLSKFESKHFE